MSEPSLRTRVALAIVEVMDGDLDAEAYAAADAALSVIHTQRDAIAAAIRDRLNPKGATPGELADAVLAMLGGTVGE